MKSSNKNCLKACYNRFKKEPKLNKYGKIIPSLNTFTEFPMDPKLMEFIIDNNKALWHETEEERNTRYKKEEYNSTIIEKIKDIKLTDKQRKVMHLMFEKGLNYRETAKELGVIITTVQEIRDAAIKKIKKAIKYNFIA